MAVTIRLQRGGNRNRAYYRLVVADDRNARDGRFIESLGVYNPLPKAFIVEFKEERYLHWIEKGAQPSDRVKWLYQEWKKGSAADRGAAKVDVIEKKQQALEAERTRKFLEERKAADEAKAAAKAAAEAAKAEEAAKEAGEGE